jgi:hypothetical protein
MIWDYASPVSSKNSYLTQCHQRLQDSHGTTRKTGVKRIIGKIGEILNIGNLGNDSTLGNRFSKPFLPVKKR